MTSDDDLTSPEARRRSDALELAGLLREVELEYAHPERNEPVQKRLRVLLDKRLIAAIQWLGLDHWVMPILNELLGHLLKGDVNFELLHEDSAYLARALKDKFEHNPDEWGLPRQDALEVAGFLRELQWKCQDRSRGSELLREAVQQVLCERLTKAKALLGPHHWIVDYLDELFDALEHRNATLDMAREDSAYVAGVLVAKFDLYSGGSYGDTGLSIKHLGLNSWKAFGFPIFMLWHHARLLARQEPHQHHHSGERG
ncbi:MAG: hypothetical protein ACLP8X_08070 [Streptosporangiaceae bacterium]